MIFRRKTATRITDGGNATSLGYADFIAYECKPPYLNKHKYVRISAATVLGEPETYAFPADEKGNIIDFTELECSISGSLDIPYVLERMGYKEIVKDDH